MSPSTPLITEGSAEHSISAVISRQPGEVVGLAHVALDELDPGLLEPRQVQFRAAAVEVVERDDLPVGVAGGERDGEVGADEAGPAGDQQAVQDGRSYHLDVWAGPIGAGRSPEQIAGRRVGVDLMLRQILATYLDTAPEALEFEYGKHGKPRLQNAGGPEFNLSHSGELLLVAVSEGRSIGVDVERVDPRRDRPATFYEEWVRREARLKCLGAGLLGELPEEPVAVENIEVDPGYAAAVAVAGHEIGTVRRFTVAAG